MNKDNHIKIARSAIRDFITQSKFDTSVLANNLEAKSILVTAEGDHRDTIIEDQEALEAIGVTIANAVITPLREGIRARLERKSTQAQSRVDALAKALEDL